MYLETRDIDETMKIYMTAWEKGVKTTYYLHMKPRHTAEQSTVAVNKAKKIGKVGFGAIAFMPKKPEVPVEPKGFAMPLQTTITALPEIDAVTSSQLTASEVAPIVSPVQQVDVEPVHITTKPTISWKIPNAESVKNVPHVTVAPVSESVPAQNSFEKVQTTTQLKVHAPSDPQDDLICDSCQ
jgi:ribonucleoside-diphosphate reductase alpha chain